MLVSYLVGALILALIGVALVGWLAILIFRDYEECRDLRRQIFDLKGENFILRSRQAEADLKSYREKHP